MSREYDALTALKNYLVTWMDAAPQTNLTASQIVIDYPDVDTMQYSVMLYIVPESGSWDNLTLATISEEMQVTLYIILQNSTTHREMSDMIEAVFDYFAAFVNAINHDATLGNGVDDTKISGFTFYPAISALTKSVGLEVNLALQFERQQLITPSETLYPSDTLIPIGG